jgi:2-phospho-L-lactate guanylyltransferase
LNTGLDEVALTIPERLLVIHGDLPLLSAPDISALLDAAESSGAAIAPDRHGQGTNALALWMRPPAYTFAYGPNSFALHQQRLGDTLAVVQRKGLACDVDTPNDLAHAQTLKYTL